MGGYKHYIRVNAQDVVIHCFSDAFEKPGTDDICINEQAGRHFELFGQVNPLITTAEGVPMYKWDGSAVVERTEQEIQDDIDALPPSPPSDKERIAQLENLVMQLSLEV